MQDEGASDSGESGAPAGVTSQTTPPEILFHTLLSRDPDSCQYGAMYRRWSAIVAFGITCLALPARGLIIDDFSVAQMASGPASTGLAVTTSVSGDMLGGSRTMAVGGVLPPAFAASAAVDSGTLSFTQSAPGQRFVDLTWTPHSFLDLTQGGAISAFVVHVDSFSEITRVSLTVSSSRFPNRAQLGYTLSGIGTLRFDFSDFPSGSSVYFQNASSVVMRVQTTGEAVLSGGLVAVPEPGSAALLLAGLVCVAVDRKQRP